VALAYQMFGVSEFAARFFSAVSATATVGLVYAFGKQVISRQYGFFAGVMLATSLMFIGIARMSITDMTLCAWMSATSLCLFLATYRD
ncbi:ArnT family glycosyltransferase, partial [Salmonella enterica]|uniref:ArnT family glycosyltransferase n=1 Tax=Salmonella enterica TaxID=28901 RepID=UPI003D27FEE7